MNTLLADLLRAAARDVPDREAIVSGDTRLTYRELDAGARSVCAAFRDLGIAAGDVVTIELPSSAEYLLAYLGAALSGAIVTGINPRLGARERAHIVASCAAPLTIDDPHAVVEWARAAPVPSDHPSLRRDPQAPLAIVWTSGTTGVPKGAVFTLNAMVAVAEGTGELNAAGDRRLSPLPFAHVGFMTRVVDELVNQTTTVVTPTPWRADAALALLESERITVGQGVPAQWSMMLADPLCSSINAAHLRVIGTGAAAVAPELVSALRDRFGCPVLVRYTSTEAALTSGTRIADPDHLTCTTVGRAQPGVEIRIVRASASASASAADTDAAETADVGEVGEICSRSAAQMSGYWNDPAATRATIDSDGWVHSGDLGSTDADGYLTFRGRSKEMFVRGGYNVYPIEVENVLLEHPAIVRAAVVGAPDDRLGEIGVAFVELDASLKAPAPTLADVRAHVGAHLADYKRPDRLVVGPIPLTAMLKPDKASLIASLTAS